MFFQKCLTSFFYPIPILVFFLILALCLPKRRKVFLLFSLGWLFLTAYPMVFGSLLKKHANLYEVVSTPSDDATAVVVLAGTSFRGNHDIPVNARLSSEGLARIVEGYRLLRLRPELSLWISIPDLDEQAALTVIEELNMLFGVSSGQILPLIGGQSTRDEARLAAKHLTENQQFYLVTHDYHLPRAILTFHHHGLNPIPAPVIQDSMDRGLRSFNPHDLIPASRHMENSRRWIHEILGIGWEKLRGKRRSLQ
jgi:uncharacterized SAM-binding protein YcdF (DUF218 family)